MENLQATLQILVKTGQIFYKNKIMSFTQEQFDALSSTLPSEWWNENDKIVYFTYYNDSSFFCEREKTVYNYHLKTNVGKIYQYTDSNNDSAKEIYNIFVSFFENLRKEDLQARRDTVREAIEKEFEVITIEYRYYRNMALMESDWTQLADVVSGMSETEVNAWKAYRQYLRDLPTTDAWVNKNYIDIVFPKTPTKVLAEYPGEDYLSSSTHFDNYATVLAQSQLSGIVRELHLPSVDKAAENTDFSDKQAVDLLIETLNNDIKTIDPDLKIELKVIAKDV